MVLTTLIAAVRASRNKYSAVHGTTLLPGNPSLKGVKHCVLAKDALSEALVSEKFVQASATFGIPGFKRSHALIETYDIHEVFIASVKFAMALLSRLDVVDNVARKQTNLLRW